MLILIMKGKVTEELMLPSKKEMIPTVAILLPILDIVFLAVSILLWTLGYQSVAVFLLVFIGFGMAIDAFFGFYFRKQTEFFPKLKDIPLGTLTVKRVNRGTYATGGNRYLDFWKSQREHAFSRYAQITSVAVGALSLYAITMPVIWNKVAGYLPSETMAFVVLGAGTFVLGFSLLLIVLLSRDNAIREDARYVLLANIPEEEEMSLAALIHRTDHLLKSSSHFQLIYVLLALGDVEKTGAIELRDNNDEILHLRD